MRVLSQKEKLLQSIQSRTLLNNILHYLIDRYPYPDDLTRLRVAKLIYLIDWKAVQETGHQLTNITWSLNQYGPTTETIAEAVNIDPELTFSETVSNFGTKKYMLNATPNHKLRPYNLSPEDSYLIDTVINETKNLFWNDFMDHVYETPPVVQAKSYGVLDLENVAKLT